MFATSWLPSTGGPLEELIRREVTIGADPIAVWDALTEEGALAAWFGAVAKIEPRRGGPVHFTWADGSERRGVILAVDPGRRLAFRWRAVSVDRSADASVVVFELEPEGGGTRVVVTEKPGILGECDRFDLAEVLP